MPTSQRMVGLFKMKRDTPNLTEDLTKFSIVLQNLTFPCRQGVCETTPNAQAKAPSIDQQISNSRPDFHYSSFKLIFAGVLLSLFYKFQEQILTEKRT